MKKYILFILFLLFFGSKLLAQEKVFMIDSSKLSYELDKFTYVWEDSNSKNIPILFYQKKDFKANQVYFCKVKITNPIKKDFNFLLEFDNFPIAELKIFDKKQNLVLFQKSNQKLLTFTISYQDTITLTFRSKPIKEIQLSKKIHLKIIENKQEKSDDFDFYFFFHGAMWLMFFYNLLFFFMVRDRAYLYYALYILCMALVSIKETHLLAKANLYYY